MLKAQDLNKNLNSRRDFPVERLVVVVDGDGELLLADGEGGRLAALHGQRRQRRAEAAAEAEEGGAVGSGRGGGGVGGRGGGSESVRVCIGWSSRIRYFEHFYLGLRNIG